MNKKGKHFTEKKEGKKIRKEEKKRKEQEKGKEEKTSLWGVLQQCSGLWELSFRYSRGLAYWGIIGGIACGVWVNG